MKKKPVYVSTRKGEPRSCPVCMSRLDGQTCMSLNKVAYVLKAGDISKCAYCGTILVAEEVGFRIAKSEDLVHLDPVLRKILELVPTLGGSKQKH